MSDELQKKVNRAIKLLQSVAKGYDGEIEVAYSGGKDSDVILELVRMSGIKYRAIYKNTTIDPAGTIAHCKENGVEIMRPQKTFFELVADMGFPNRFTRFCCKYLKEYKVLDKCVMGVRRAESIKRAKRYTEPTECRYYGAKSDPKNHVEAVYPILDWTDSDIVEFINERGIKLHPLYYREDGSIDPKRRLGCMCCPLASIKIRQGYFLRYPNMVKAYIRAGQKFRDTHPDAKTVMAFDNIYEWFVRAVFYEHQSDWQNDKDCQLFGSVDYRQMLMDYFHIDLPELS